jgi:hypothetical protein
MNFVGAQETGFYGLWHQNGRFAESAKLHGDLEIFASFHAALPPDTEITPGEIGEQAFFSIAKNLRSARLADSHSEHVETYE